VRELLAKAARAYTTAMEDREFADAL
jgi:hypothetical protein